MFLIKIQNWSKNRNFIKSKYLVKTRNFGQNSQFWSKLAILVKTRNFGQKSKFWSKLAILVKNRNFGQKSKFWSKFCRNHKTLAFDNKLRFNGKRTIRQIRSYSLIKTFLDPDSIKIFQWDYPEHILSDNENQKAHQLPIRYTESETSEDKQSTIILNIYDSERKKV